MPDPTQTTVAQCGPQTDLAIVAEIERIAVKIGSTNLTDLEIALLMAFMPGLIREYREMREIALNRPAPRPAPQPIRHPATPQPRLHLVGSAEECCP